MSSKSAKGRNGGSKKKKESDSDSDVPKKKKKIESDSDSDSPKKRKPKKKKVDEFESKFDPEAEKLIEELNKFKKNIQGFRDSLATLQRIHKSEIKSALNFKRPPDPNRPKYGIAAVSRVPDSLTTLLKLKKGVKLPRTQVTKKLYEYISEKGLKDEDDKKIIHADKNLKAALLMKKNETLTFENFQTYVSRAYTEENDEPKPKRSKSL